MVCKLSLLEIFLILSKNLILVNLLNVFKSIGLNSQKKTLSNNLTDEQADELIELFSDNSMAEHKRNVEKE